jgi:hypothetical protein
MPYSIMIWLVDREHELEGQEARPNRHDPELTPGASSGVTAPPAFDRLNYGFYETEHEAEAALKDISKDLEKNSPVTIRSGTRTFLIPATRVHYVVCDEVIRPKDESVSAFASVDSVVATV